VSACWRPRLGPPRRLPSATWTPARAGSRPHPPHPPKCPLPPTPPTPTHPPPPHATLQAGPGAAGL
jgi:hypothetical protein